ncbi:MAG: hypothetical protein IJW31_02290 [Lentisphaeria bacterium]|nr:hypothetical protein [Lentisphaeria bacterium]
MGEISLKEINQTGLIITLSREIESLMTQLGATEAGLHDKTDHLASKLPEECVKLLHYIAAVRNKNAHESAVNEDFDMEFFSQSCELVMEELRQLLLKEKNTEVEINTAPQLNHEVENTEAKFSSEFQAMMRICGYLPIFNGCFFLYKLAVQVVKAIDMVAGIVFFLMSMIIITGSLLDRNYPYFYCGLILFGGVYLYGIILALISKEKIKNFRNFAFIPIFNFGYFIYGSYVKFKVASLIYYAIALGLYISSFVFYYKFSNFSYALHSALGCYLMGLVGAINDTIRGKIKKN